MEIMESDIFFEKVTFSKREIFLSFNPIPHGGYFSLPSPGGGVNLTRTYLTVSDGPIRHILCNIIEGTFKGGHL